MICSWSRNTRGCESCSCGTGRGRQGGKRRVLPATTGERTGPETTREFPAVLLRETPRDPGGGGSPCPPSPPHLRADRPDDPPQEAAPPSRPGLTRAPCPGEELGAGDPGAFLKVSLAKL